MKFDQKGVYNDPACKNDMNSLDHGIALVGYDINEGSWLLRNSWGELFCLIQKNDKLLIYRETVFIFKVLNGVKMVISS
jgi:hypothetical protein